MATLLKGGTVISSRGETPADVRLENGLVSAVGADLPAGGA